MPPSALLDVTEVNFDVLLREVPVALVAFTSPTTAVRHPALLPALEQLAAAFAATGIGIGQVSSVHRELLDRLGVDTYPTLLWLDGSREWPHYASEATPVRYSGLQSYEALAAYVEHQTGISAHSGRSTPMDATPPPPPPPPMHAAPSAPPLTTSHHDAHGAACVEHSQSYRACMRHRRDRQHLCDVQRHDYLLCMSGRWAVHPDHHRDLAALYGRHFSDEAH